MYKKYMYIYTRARAHVCVCVCVCVCMNLYNLSFRICITWRDYNFFK